MGLRRGVGPGGRLYCQQAVLLIALEANCQTLDGWGRRGDALRCRSSVCVSRGVNLSLAESVSLQRPATTEEGVGGPVLDHGLTARSHRGLGGTEGGGEGWVPRGPLGGRGGGENYSLRFYLSLCHPAIVVLTATTKARVHG